VGGPSGINVLDARVAVVTGAARNIGRATALALADAGACVLATDRDEVGLARTVDRIARRHGADRVASTVVDLRDPAAPAAVIHHAATRFGALDIVVHSAVNNTKGDLESYSPEVWDEIQAVNVRAGAFLVRAALPHLDASDHAAVVLFSSVHARATHPSCTAYAASKGAVDGLVRALAVELGPRGIRVNGLHPGYVPADDHAPPPPAAYAGYPLRRHGRPEEIAATVVFLASDAASWTTGALLDVDGGMLALSPEAAGFRGAGLGKDAPTWRDRVKRFGGRSRR
jgi:NAD(P)-dependent dehydrogenase (short-subunit alcohol dehydrogenase family)